MTCSRAVPWRPLGIIPAHPAGAALRRHRRHPPLHLSLPLPLLTHPQTAQKRLFCPSATASMPSYIVSPTSRQQGHRLADLAVLDRLLARTTRPLSRSRRKSATHPPSGPRPPHLLTGSCCRSHIVPSSTPRTKAAPSDTSTRSSRASRQFPRTQLLVYRCTADSVPRSQCFLPQRRRHDPREQRARQGGRAGRPDAHAVDGKRRAASPSGRW